MRWVEGRRGVASLMDVHRKLCMETRDLGDETNIPLASLICYTQVQLLLSESNGDRLTGEALVSTRLSNTIQYFHQP